MNSTKVGSNFENKLVDSIPEHSNSDIEGSIASEDIFKGNTEQNGTHFGSLNVFNIAIGSPFMIGVTCGLILCIFLILVTTCVILNICR